MMNIAICEDDKKEQNHLSDIIMKWADAKNANTKVLCYDSAEEFLFAWPDIKIDIAFIDIELRKNGKSGITLAKTLRKDDSDIQIVFTTKHKQYSLDGYEVYPLHYLIKPLNKNKLLVILDKTYYSTNSHKKDLIIIPNGNEITRLQTNKIHFIKMKSHLAELHLEDEVILLRKTSSELLSLLPSHFVRCHRSYMVNLLKVDCVYSTSVLLTNGKEVPVSRNEGKGVREAFMGLNRV